MEQIQFLLGQVSVQTTERYLLIDDMGQWIIEQMDAILLDGSFSELSRETDASQRAPKNWGARKTGEVSELQT
jgi:hypothetical protein